MRWTALTIVALASLGAGFASPEPVVFGHTDTLDSEILGEERRVMVFLPEEYDSGRQSYPVIYLLDARANFLHTAGTASTLARVGHAPHAILVAVLNTDRTRDLTSPWTAEGEIPEFWQASVEQGGGAAEFRRFLTEELAPWVEQRYRTVPFRVLIGHSFGGLFALQTLFTQPDAYDGYVAIAPSAHWDDGVLLRQLDGFVGTELSRPKFLFMSIADEGGDMLTRYREIVERLRYEAPEGLSWDQRELPDDDHGSVTLRSTYHGLQTLFDRWRMPAAARAGGLAGVERHYATLSERYGYAIAPPEGVVNNLGYQVLGAGDHAAAIRIFELNVERYPDSANVYDSLGEGLEAAGELERALENYERACELGQEDDPNLPFYQQHRDALRELLSEGRPTARTETLPTPFSAEQIRDSFRVGLEITLRTSGPDGTQRERWRVVDGDTREVAIEYTPLDDDGSAAGDSIVRRHGWDELRDHARFPSATAVRERATVETSLGEHDGWLYRVRNDVAGTTTEFFFAEALPGAPVEMRVLRDGVAVMEMAQESRQDPES